MNWLDGFITTYGKDYVTARWHGKVRPTTTELYTLHVVADDGVRLWIDHNLVVDAWESSSSGIEKRAEVAFTAGAFHDIKMEYREETGPAMVSLSWSSNSIVRQIIPSSVFYRAEHIVGSPHQIVVVPGAADYPYTTAYGAGLETLFAGIDAIFTIQSRDAKGNNKTLGGDVFDVHVTGPDKLTVTPSVVTENTNAFLSQLQVVHTPLTIGGTHIYCGLGSASACSPFSVVVAPGPTSHETTVATGSGLSNAVAGVVSSFSIQAKDTYGNNRLVGGDAFDIKLVHKVSGTSFSAIVDDNEDGTYDVTYTVLEAGSYTVEAFYGGQRILTDGTHDASEVLCLHWDLHAPSTTATGLGLTEATSTAEATFNIHSKDAFSNDRDGTGSGNGNDDRFTVRLVGPGGAEVFTTSASVLITTSSSLAAVEGWFTVTWDGQTTPALPADVDPATLDTVLEELHVQRSYQQGVLPTDIAGTRRTVDVTRVATTNGFTWRIVFTLTPRLLVAVAAIC